MRLRLQQHDALARLMATGGQTIVKGYEGRIRDLPDGKQIAIAERLRRRQAGESTGSPALGGLGVPVVTPLKASHTFRSSK